MALLILKNFRLLTIALVLGLFSCRQVELFEQNKNIPNQEWRSDFIIKGKVQILDTTALYNIFLVLRHTDAYQYNNIWLNIGLKAPGDTMRLTKTELQLGTDAQGWEGSGMNDIWELRKKLNAVPEPIRKSGTYEFSIAQIMRDEPLRNVLSAGIRVEKITN